jgi:hypothetical protein
LAAALGLCGLRWGLPDAARLRAFPTGRPDAETARRLEESWRSLYKDIEASHRELRSEEPVTYLRGSQVIEPGWTLPPPALVNSYRSMLLHSAHPDEKKSFIILSRMRAGDLRPLYIQYGGAFIYPLGAFLKAASLLGAFRTGDLGFYLQHPEEMARAYLCGRVFVLLGQLAAVLAIFECGLLLGGPKTGLWAALLYALCPLAIDNSHLIKPHAYSALCAAIALYWALRALKTGLRRDFVLCGAAVGLAAGASLTLLPLAGLPLLVRWQRRGALAPALQGVGAALAVAFLSNPFVLIRPGDFAWETQIYPRKDLGLGLDLIGRLARSSVVELGAPFALLAAVSWALAWRRAGAPRLLAAAVLLGGAPLWLAFHGYVREPDGLRVFLALFPALALLGAAQLARLRPPAARLLLAFALTDAGLRSAALLSAMHADSGEGSTRARAARWIDENVPRGDSIGLARLPEPESTPPFKLAERRLALFDRPESLAPGQEPAYVVADPQVLPAIGDWLGRGYERVQAFEPPHVSWAEVPEDSFVDRRIYVFKRRAG